MRMQMCMRYVHVHVHAHAYVHVPGMHMYACTPNPTPARTPIHNLGREKGSVPVRHSKVKMPTHHQSTAKPCERLGHHE